MPVVRSTRNHDDDYHYLRDQEVGEESTTSRPPAETGARRHRRRTFPGDPASSRRYNPIMDDPRGDRNGRSPRPRASTSYLRRWLAHENDEDYYADLSTPDPYDTLTDDEYPQTPSPGDTSPTKHHCIITPFTDETCVDAIHESGSQEEFDEDVMIYYNVIEPSLASQFLNDDPLWGHADQAATTTATGGTPEWDLEPTSLHLLDMERFETVTDFDGDKKANPWPWSDYTYQPCTNSGRLDLDDFVAEWQIKQIEKALWEEMSEIMAQDAILAGEVAEMARKQRGGKTGGKSAPRWGSRPGTIAFNNHVVRGRTIYNP